MNVVYNDYAGCHEPCYGDDYEYTDSGLITDEPDMVNHPAHYQSKAGLEVIDVMEAFTEGLSGIEAVDTAQVIKYICRWKGKNGLQDLNKAKWYLEHLIWHVENTTKKGE
jgi:tRNA (Thr-GGU) A37 N-methylase